MQADTIDVDGQVEYLLGGGGEGEWIKYSVLGVSASQWTEATFATVRHW